MTATSRIHLTVIAFATLLAGCATTRVDIAPAQPVNLCQPIGREETALVVWRTQWRPDQKDVLERVQAADSGIRRFFTTSNCYTRASVRRVDTLAEPEQSTDLLVQEARADVLVSLKIRELGPVVKILASPSLVEGGTEVVFDLAVQRRGVPQGEGEYTVHWTHGGPGVVKGTASLPDDMHDALAAAFFTR
jgi:hypothetical protein